MDFIVMAGINKVNRNGVNSKKETRLAFPTTKNGVKTKVYRPVITRKADITMYAIGRLK
tara:strand:- start:1655 stop:1831 length:177 start_codon:yes stop_codon:yes gene_type:complete